MFIENDAFATNVNEGICGAEVDREIGREVLREERKHVAILVTGTRFCVPHFSPSPLGEGWVRG